MKSNLENSNIITTHVITGMTSDIKVDDIPTLSDAAAQGVARMMGRYTTADISAAAAVGPNTVTPDTIVRNALADKVYIKLPQKYEDLLAKTVYATRWLPISSQRSKDVTATDNTDTSAATCFGVHVKTDDRIAANGGLIPESEYICTGAYEMQNGSISVDGGTACHGASIMTGMTLEPVLSAFKTNYTFTTLGAESQQFKVVDEISTALYSAARTAVGPLTPLQIAKLMPDQAQKPTIVHQIMFAMLNLSHNYIDTFGQANCPWFDIAFANVFHNDAEEAGFDGFATLLACYTTFANLREDMQILADAGAQCVYVPVSGNTMKARVVIMMGVIPKRIRHIMPTASIRTSAVTSEVFGGANALSWLPNTSRLTNGTSARTVVFIMPNAAAYTFDGIALNRPGAGYIDIAARFAIANWATSVRQDNFMAELNILASMASPREFLEAALFTSAIVCRLPYTLTGLGVGASTDHNGMAMMWWNIAQRTQLPFGDSVTPTGVANYAMGPSIVTYPSLNGSTWLGQITKGNIDSAFGAETLATFWPSMSDTITLTVPKYDSLLYGAMLMGLAKPIDTSAQYVFNQQLGPLSKLMSWLRLIAAILMPIGVAIQSANGFSTTMLTTSAEVAADATTYGFGYKYEDRDRLSQKIQLDFMNNPQFALSLYSRSIEQNEFVDYGAVHVYARPHNHMAFGILTCMQLPAHLYCISHDNLVSTKDWNSKSALTDIYGTTTVLHVDDTQQDVGFYGPYIFGVVTTAATATTSIVQMYRPVRTGAISIPVQHRIASVYSPTWYHAPYSHAEYNDCAKVFDVVANTGVDARGDYYLYYICQQSVSLSLIGNSTMIGNEGLTMKKYDRYGPVVANNNSTVPTSRKIRID